MFQEQMVMHAQKSRCKGFFVENHEIAGFLYKKTFTNHALHDTIKKCVEHMNEPCSQLCESQRNAMDTAITNDGLAVHELGGNNYGTNSSYAKIRDH